MQAQGAAAALHLLRQVSATSQPFPIVLLALENAEPDGFHLAQQLRQAAAPSKPGIILIATVGQRGDALRCRAEGIDAYLTPPYPSSTLLNTITALLLTGERALLRTSLVTKHSIRESRKDLKILLAEDNLVNQELAVELLESYGHQVQVADNGRAAVDLYQTQPFDLVLMDVQMPIMGGFEATALIRAAQQATGQHIPVIALTAHAMKGDRERCLAAGMDDYLTKPIQIKSLLTVLGNVAPAELAEEAPVTSQEARTAEVLLDSVINKVELMERMAGKIELIKKISLTFFNTYPKQLAQLKAAIEQADSQAVANIAHSLKGAICTFAATSATEAARKLEMIGRSGDLQTAEAALEVLEIEVAQFRNALTLLLEGK